MRLCLLAVYLVTLTACAGSTAQTTPMPPPRLQEMIGQPAPALANRVWFNTSAPLDLSDLRGKVVLIHFWSFDCKNCKRAQILPALNSWHSSYGSQGLVIIGDHFPSFPYEREPDQLKAAIAREQIGYAVAEDNEALTWGKYRITCWGSLMLIDKRGVIRYSRDASHEAPDDPRGNAETEAAFKSLLAESYP